MYLKEIPCINKVTIPYHDVLPLNNAERPKVRNSKAGVKQKMLERTALVEFLISIFPSYFDTLLRYVGVQ